MSEYKKEISVAVVIALIAALGIGLLSIYAFPSSPSGNFGGPSGGTPKALLGYLSTDNVTCTLENGVCTFTIVNNSTAPLELTGCMVQVIESSAGANTTWGLVMGTMSGPAVAGIPASSAVGATCAIPTPQLAHQPAGSEADGSFTVKLLQSWDGYPAGDEPTFNFEGTWTWQ